MKQTHCDECGDPLPPGYRRWCDKPACRRAAEKEGHRQAREYQRRNGGSRRRPDDLRPPYNSDLCNLCHKPLGRTFNRYYHVECHRKISHVEGLECFELPTYQHNGRYAHG